MARMYSRNRGKSGSTKPAVKEAGWVTHKAEEIEEIIAKLANDGRTSSQIGIILRDQYGIPSVKTVGSRKIYAVMKEKKVTGDIPEDMMSLLKNAVELRAHLSRNSHDRYSKRGLELTESKIRRLAKYYKGKDMLPQKWNYDPEKAKLLVK
ncbi:MAG: 30S ribosomal protein S15 [Candidatus Aenigmarchaeota archaeon]|nr:30S ribosomal protein S15 [Candidatus Aenigmarchaeota archaeon]